MSELTMPSINVAFRQAAATARMRSQKGTVAVLLRDAAMAEKHFAITNKKQIPEALGAENRAALERVLLGGVRPPRSVLAYVLAADGTITADCAPLAWLATQDFDYLAGPADLSAAEAAVLKDWIAAQREDNDAKYKAVLPGLAADSYAVVNFTGSGIRVGAETFDAAGYCGRIAGLLAGTPMRQSATYADLPEAEDVARLTTRELDAAVGRGEFVLFWDGEKVKTGRAVNSLTTTKGLDDRWKKIKIVELLDMVRTDIRRTARDHWVGKYPCSYANKLVLVTAIREYLADFSRDELIDGDYTCDIDAEAQGQYLQDQGVDTRDMTEQQLRQANTGTHVFLKITIRPIDAMEDIDVVIEL